MQKNALNINWSQLSLLPSVGQELSSNPPSVGYGVKVKCVWLGRCVVIAALRVQFSVSTGNGLLHNELHQHQLMQISCQF